MRTTGVLYHVSRPQYSLFNEEEQLLLITLNTLYYCSAELAKTTILLGLCESSMRKAHPIRPHWKGNKACHVIASQQQQQHP